MRLDVCFCRPFPAQTATAWLVAGGKETRAKARELSVGTGGGDTSQPAVLPIAEWSAQYLISSIGPKKKNVIPICFEEPKTFNYTTN